ncbi:MAG: hypothetical protein ACR2PR_00175 [Pseudohongiellaceae bacterium]
MSTLNMHGPYSLDTDTINKEVTNISPGNYALGEDDANGEFEVKYVGRSDGDVNHRLRQWPQNTELKKFMYSYADTPQEAFEKECTDYHDFDPSHNENHPAQPDDTDLKCPVCNT